VHLYEPLESVTVPSALLPIGSRYCDSDLPSLSKVVHGDLLTGRYGDGGCHRKQRLRPIRSRMY